MRKYLLIAFLFAFVGVFGQTNDTTKYFKSVDYGWQYKRLKIDSIIVLPNGVVVNRAYKFLSASDTAAMLAPYAKTSAIPSLTPYMKYADSAAMLSPYVRTSNLPSLAPYVKYTDTSSMLSPYAKSINVPSLSGVVKYSDTSSMLSAYYNKTATDSKVNLKVNISDTANMLSGYVRTNNIPSSTTVVKYSDTSSMLSGYYRASNPSGYINASAIANKVNYSDTASMLSPYARTANIPSPSSYVKYVDTAAMLTPYSKDYNVVHLAGTEIISGTKTTKGNFSVGDGTQRNTYLNINTDTNGTAFGLQLLYKGSPYGGLIFDNVSYNTNLQSARNGGSTHIAMSANDGNTYIKYIYGNALSVTGSTGALAASSLAGTGTRMVTADASGNLSTQSIPSTTGLVQYTDTALMLSPYQRSYNAVKYSDTSSILSGYYRNSNPSGYITSSAISGKVNYTDTASMLSPYLRSANASATYLTQTNAASTYYLQSNPSGYITSSAISGKVNYTDTATMLSAYYNKTAANALLATKEPTIATGTTSQYWRGDKTWQTLDKTAVGLSNVTNNAQVTSVTGTSPIVSSGGTTPAISINQANATTNGYLSSTDWTTFNGKQGALTFSAPLVNTTGTITITKSDATHDGYLSSTDWGTFNGKQSAITLTTTGSSGAATFVTNTLNVPNYTLAGLGGQPQLNGTGFVKASGTTISYDNSTYLTTTGTAANSMQWNGATYSSSVLGTAATNVMVFDGSNYRPGNTTSISTWLGLGTNAYTSTAYLPLSGGNMASGATIGGTAGGYFFTGYSSETGGQSIVFSSATRTGNPYPMDFFSDNGYSFFNTAGNNNFLNITSGGIVQIGGTANASGLISINTSNPTFSLGNSASGINYNALIGQAGAGNYHIQGTNAGDLAIRPQSTKDIVFGSIATSGGIAAERMRIAASGGITMQTTATNYSSFNVQRNGSSSVQSGYQLSSASGTVYSANLQLGATGSLDFWTYDAASLGWGKYLSIAATGAASFSSSISANTGSKISGTLINAAGLLQLQDGGRSASTAQNYMSFADNAGTRMGIIGSTGDGNITLASDASRNIILNGGNVGINTITPNDKLSISGGNVNIGNNYTASYPLDVNSTSDTYMRIRKQAYGGYTGIYFETANNFSGTSQAYIQSYGAGTNGTSYLTFGTAPSNSSTTASEVMRITSSGAVGIGTTQPVGTVGLNIYGGDGNNPAILTLESYAGGGGNTGLYFRPYHSVSQANSNPAQAAILAVDDNYGAQIQFWNKTQGAVSNAMVQRGQFTATGILKIADGSGNLAGTSGTERLNVNGDIYASGNLIVSGTTFGGVTTQAYGYGHIYKGYTGSSYDVQIINSGNTWDEVTIQGGIRMSTTTAGFIFPRMSTTQKNALNKTAGMVVYDTTANLLQCWNGATWNNLW
jgi:hypothetical protein